MFAWNLKMRFVFFVCVLTEKLEKQHSNEVIVKNNI